MGPAGPLPVRSHPHLPSHHSFTRSALGFNVFSPSFPCRLRFLVKKWQEVDRKGALVLSRASRPGGTRPSRACPSECGLAGDATMRGQGPRPSQCHCRPGGMAQGMWFLGWEQTVCAVGVQ